MERAADWAREFVRGGHREKAKTLNLIGYTPMQSASYFLLPLTEQIHLFAIDRQLKSLDFRQRRFFSSWHTQHPGVAPWVVMPDPPYKFGVESASGVGMWPTPTYRRWMLWFTYQTFIPDTIRYLRKILLIL